MTFPWEGFLLGGLGGLAFTVIRILWSDLMKKRKPKKMLEPKYLLRIQLQIQLDPESVDTDESAGVVSVDLFDRLQNWLNRAGFRAHRIEGAVIKIRPDPENLLAALIHAAHQTEGHAQAMMGAHLDKDPTIILAEQKRILH